MTRRFRIPLALLALLVALPISGQSLQEEVAWDLNQLRAKYVQLLGAMPDDALAWRPAEGVRSSSEVFMHVAMANLGLPSMLLGAPAASGADPSWSEDTMDRAGIEAALEAGFDHAVAMVRATPDADLTDPTDVFGRATNLRGAILLLQTHTHEHLGQLIAYARTNGVVPPWSM